MNKIFYFSRFLMFLLLVILLNNCNKESEKTDFKIKSECIIFQSINTLQSDSDIQVEITNYSFDVNENLAKTTLAIDRTDKIGKKSGSLQTQTFNYNSSGFLMEKIITIVYSEADGTIRKRTENQTFTYKNDLLSTSETKVINVEGKETKSSESYSYDANGKISSKIQVRNDGSMLTHTYSNDGTLMSVVLKSGSKETRFQITDGLITDNGDNKFIYNDKKQMIKSETYVNGKLNSYATYDWSDALPATRNLPKFKGFPCECASGMGVGINERMEISTPLNKFQFFADVYNNGKIQQLNESVYTVQKNAKGYVSKIDLINKQFQANSNDPANTLKSTQTFTYTDCN